MILMILLMKLKIIIWLLKVSCHHWRRVEELMSTGWKSSNCKQGLANIGITHVFSSINICRSRGSCLNTRLLGRVFKHRPRDPACVNAMKQTCVIVILVYFTWFQHKPRWKRRLNIKYPFSYAWFLKTKWRLCQLSNVITSPQRHIYACNVFANGSIREMISHGRNAFQCNVMHANQGSV